MKAIPQPMVIENKAGGSGVVGKSYAKEKPADGHTLVNADDSTSFTYLTGATPWEYDDFTFIANIDRDYNMIVVRRRVPLQDPQGHDRRRQGQPQEGQDGRHRRGPGGQHPHHPLWEERRRGNYNYVSFDSGGQVMTNLLGGQVDAAMANPSEAYEQMRAGKVRALGISAPERDAAFNDPMFKDIPTWKESGVNLAMAQWRGITAPPKTKKEHSDWLIAMVKKVTDTQGVEGPVPRQVHAGADLRGGRRLQEGGRAGDRDLQARLPGPGPLQGPPVIPSQSHGVQGAGRRGLPLSSRRLS